MTADQVVTQGPAREPHHGYDPVSIAVRRSRWEQSLATGRRDAPRNTTDESSKEGDLGNA